MTSNIILSELQNDEYDGERVMLNLLQLSKEEGTLKIEENENEIRLTGTIIINNNQQIKPEPGIQGASIALDGRERPFIRDKPADYCRQKSTNAEKSFETTNEKTANVVKQNTNGSYSADNHI